MMQRNRQQTRIRHIMCYRFHFIIALTFTATSAMAIDLTTLWDFKEPEASEQRFREALKNSSGDDALILQTQIARTYGLRKNLSKAQDILKSVEKRIPSAGPEVRARYALELGRTYASAAHPPEQQTADARNLARIAYESALATSREAHLDGLSIDAIHMLAFVDTAPADQLKWAREAMAVVETSSQPDAKKWEASIRNNIGYALHELGRFDEALASFKQAVVLREQGTNAEATRTAHWMVAWTLRALGRVDEALEIQLRLERECEKARAPDPYVFEELELLYRAQGDESRANHYGLLRKSNAD